MALLQDTVRTATVEAVTFCDLYKLSKDEFQKVINLHPEIMETFEQIVKTYKKES
jgi:CRP-like cAMP-binding protein